MDVDVTCVVDQDRKQSALQRERCQRDRPQLRAAVHIWVGHVGKRAGRVGWRLQARLYERGKEVEYLREKTQDSPGRYGSGRNIRIRSLCTGGASGV